MKMYKYKVTFSSETDRRSVYIKTHTHYFYRQTIIHSAYCKLVSKYDMAYVNMLCDFISVRYVKEYSS